MEATAFSIEAHSLDGTGVFAWPLPLAAGQPWGGMLGVDKVPAGLSFPGAVADMGMTVKHKPFLGVCIHCCPRPPIAIAALLEVNGKKVIPTGCTFGVQNK